jgi:aminoglycoside phosphotransferase (APT) family kinase protein
MTDEQTFEELVRRIDPDAELLRGWSLTGGVSAQITALEVKRRDGRIDRLVVRRHGAIDRVHNPHVARDEYKLLEVAQAHGLTAPKPYFLDESCELFPTPLLVIEFVEGETILEPADAGSYLRQMAEQLAKIHAVRTSAELAFLPHQEKGWSERPAILDLALSEDRIRDALEAAWPSAHISADGLLHGDYWPGNILWRDGRLAAVIDWEDAHTGDPLADLGNCRLELLWALGGDAMTEFTDQYRSLTSTDLANLAYWDLVAALRPCGKLSGWALDAETEERMRARHRWFGEQAIDLLATRGR